VILDQFGNPIRSSPDAKAREWAASRWESAETTRLNKHHWSHASGNTINADLRDKLSELWKRVAYEVANNPIIAGMVATHQTDMVGKHGPTLDVITSDDDRADAYASALEDVWRDWWASPDINGQLSGPDLLAQWVYMLWHTGEFLGQIVTDRSRFNRDPVKARIYSLHPRKLSTPPGAFSASTRIDLGVETNRTGGPAYYWIDDSADTAFSLNRENWRRMASRNVIHQFLVNEPGQLRGIPFIASVLNTCADLREHDYQVLQAAKNAAKMGIILTATKDDVDTIVVNESVELEGGLMTTAPPGWGAALMDPKQPSTNYVDFRRERMADMGRPANMPVNVVRLDSSKHNFSSARFDAQLYARSNVRLQGWLERNTLNRLLVEVVEREAVLAGELNGERPKRVEFNWTWPPPLYRAGDPMKEARAAEIRLRAGISTLSDELAEAGRHFETHLKQLRREAEKARAMGLTLPTQSDGSAESAITQLFHRAIDEFADRVSDQAEEPEGVGHA